MTDASSIVVRGEIVIPPATSATTAAQLVVQVEDVSRADARSEVIAEQRQPAVTVTAGATIPFEVEVAADRVKAKRRYSIRAHVDISGSGAVEVGDLISTQSYPILARGHPEHVTVSVKKV